MKNTKFIKRFKTLNNQIQIFHKLICFSNWTWCSRRLRLHKKSFLSSSAQTCQKWLPRLGLFVKTDNQGVSHLWKINRAVHINGWKRLRFTKAFFRVSHFILLTTIQASDFSRNDVEVTEQSWQQILHSFAWKNAQTLLPVNLEASEQLLLYLNPLDLLSLESY